MQTKIDDDKFEVYKQEVVKSLNLLHDRIKNEKQTRSYINPATYPLENLEQEIISIIGNAFAVENIQEISLSEPPNHIKSDFVVNVFDFAKKLKISPKELSVKLSNEIGKHIDVENSYAAGGYINIEINKQSFYSKIIKSVLQLGELYGQTNSNAGKLVIIDYSSPNIAKPIGVNHLRSTIIGQSLANLYYETGFIVIKANHLGDWGTQFGSLIYAYNTWGNEELIKQNPLKELKNLYVKFNQYAKEHPEIEDNARELFAKLEQKNSSLIKLWKRFRDLSLADFESVYNQLGIKFDTNIGESYFTNMADSLVNDCTLSGFCRKEDLSKAIIVDQIEDLPSFLLRKQDGSSLYISRDLATLKFRVDDFNPDVILYVVGDEQELNFKQLFAFAKLTGYLPCSTNTKHIMFGLVLCDGKKMSTRKGTLVELEDLITQSISKAREILLTKRSDFENNELEEVAKTVGIGAVIYNDLRQSRIKNIEFDWDRMLDFNGGSAVYLQYTFVRIGSIMKKMTENYGTLISNFKGFDELHFEKSIEFNLAKKLSFFPKVIIKSQKTDSPHHICIYLEELAQLFNNFYSEISILNTSDIILRNSRIMLIDSVAIVIRKGLLLLNIQVPTKM